MSFASIISALGVSLATTSIFLLFITEWIRRPYLEFVEHKDEPTPEDRKHGGYMWYHLKVRNKEPKLFNRDTALQCAARIEFLDKANKSPLVGQISAHWVSQPEPRDFRGVFDYTKVPMCQRIDVGFREEMFDVFIKFEGENGFYATDPWIIYPFLGGMYKKEASEMQKMYINASECTIKVELEAINLGKRKVAYFHLKNKGTKMDDIEITPLDP